MSYSLVRTQGTVQTTADQLDAEVAVRLMRDWAASCPQEFLMLRDDAGRTVAFRRPADQPATAALARSYSSC